MAREWTELRRVVDLLDRARDRRRGLEVHDAAEAWGEVSTRTVQRTVAAVRETIEALRLPVQVRGRGRGLRVVWEDRDDPFAVSRSLLGRLVTLPWSEQEGVDGVIPDPEEPDGGLDDRLLWYQPVRWPAVRDPDAVDEVISALLHRRPLHIAAYHPHGGAPRLDQVFEPWTLVMAEDSLFVVGRWAHAPDDWPRALAVRRIEGASRLKDRHVVLPDDYHPRDWLGHGFGPFVERAEGTTVVELGEHEAAFAFEHPDRPARREEPCEEPGRRRFRLRTPRHRGVEVWAQRVGAEIVAPERAWVRGEPPASAGPW